MNKDGGFIKIYRSMLSWEWHDDPITVATWIYCLERANWETTRWHGQIIKPGQFITSLGHMAKDIGISRQNLKTALNHLKSTNNLTSKPTNRYTLVTIENYGLYQSAGEKVTNKLTSKLTSNQPTTNQQLTTDKNNKEYKEREERENKRESEGQGAFAGAWFHDPDTYSVEETNAIMKSAHEEWIKATRRDYE